MRPGDLAGLTAAVNELLIDPTLQGTNASMTSSIPQMTGQITSGWRTLDVPVFLITCQLLLLAWLLLFLIVTDAAEARAGEVALAKLRGHGRLRTIAFGLSEPVLLLAVALPVGLLAGWAATAGLTRILLRPARTRTCPCSRSRPRRPPRSAASWRSCSPRGARLARPVTEQWRRTARGARTGAGCLTRCCSPARWLGWPSWSSAAM